MDEDVNNHSRSGGGYESPQAGLTAVAQWFGNWTQKLADSSLQLSYALIAANWAVFGSVDQVLRNLWSRASLFLVIAFLGVNLLATFIISELLRRQYSAAEKDPARWEDLFRRTKGRDHPWPSTSTIDGLS